MPRKDPEERKAYSKAYYAANKDRKREYNEKWRRDNLEKFSEYSKRYRDKHPGKHPARIAVSRAVKSGLLVRPTRCSKCATLCTPEGHHEDYSKPLSVVWLCKPCHEQLHHEATTA